MSPVAASPITIRAAAAADAAAIAAIYAHHVARGTASFDTAPRPASDFAAQIERAQTRGWPFLVADDGGGVVGYASAVQFRDRPAYATTCENSVYVAGHAVGRGIGTALLKRLIDEATAAGFRQMIAVIGGADAASAACHAGVGFVEAGRMKSVGRKFGRWLDTLYMQRALGEGAETAPAVEP